MDNVHFKPREPILRPSVSVIVPVYNPGAHIDDCIASLLAQTLPAGRLELIFVDDGSTDGTAERLDALAAAHPHVRVEHIPNSGWPGRPRNLGLDMARGEYVYFVDNDDWLEPDALARLEATARQDAADIVIGKVVGHGKRVPRELFRENLHAVPFDSAKLLGLLTPHKLFRRQLLDAHRIRFPEGRRRLEDHLFVVHAYFHAQGISVLADRPCYHWTLRDPSRERVVPAARSGGLFRQRPRGARPGLRAHRAGPLPRQPARALVPRQDARARGRRRLHPARRRVQPPPRGHDPGARARALPRARALAAGVQPARPRGAAA